MGGAAGGGAGAAAAAAVQAIKASGVVVQVEPDEFSRIVARHDEPIVVTSESRFLGTTYKYLTTYKGLAFFAKSREPISLPGRCEIVRAKTIWVPG